MSLEAQIQEMNTHLPIRAVGQYSASRRRPEVVRRERVRDIGIEI